MDKLLPRTIKPYYETEDCKLILGDSFEILPKIKANSIDMIFADPPYFLSNGGITCKSGKIASVNKGKWDKKNSFNEVHTFNRKWIRRSKRILKTTGSIWISGTMHNIYSIGMALQQEGFVILNNITWEKTNPPPNLACRCFTHSTETILWACLKENKPKHIFNYNEMRIQNGNKQMKDVWQGSLTSKKEKSEGKHPTQKPLYILERIIEASTNEGNVILDPFSGSSTTGIAALKLNRQFIGIEKELEYIKLSKRRFKKIN
ncbi:MAG: DNA methyltransferase [Sphaerochaetaceae bacterium]|nr:DNA methyltransferase [Sphaerochaetaceae bacterium]